MKKHACCGERRRDTGSAAVPSEPSVSAEPEDPADPPEESREAALAAMTLRWPFGPAFFLGQLGAFVREKCPEPGEGLPVVEIHVADGDVLDLCHVMGVAPTWVALAVNELEAPEGAPPMRTELVPYGRIVQVTVRSSRVGRPELGFSDKRARKMFEDGAMCSASPESALRAAAAVAPEPPPSQRARGPNAGRSAPA